ncbi:MAG TPA: acyl-CoA dehydrogenase family protein [Acidimicrobiales bacterium]|nr:acyl-CoA dehydrogenase family protein [Acidimicrobiales bacterium]
MDFRFSDKANQLRAEVRSFLGQTMTPDLRARLHHTGTFHDSAFLQALVDRGWLELGWPSPAGPTASAGRTASAGPSAADPMDSLPLLEELDRAGAPTDAIKTTMMIARTVERVGTEEQKMAVLPGVLAGQILFALGFSEPDSGSDVAACKTSATKDGDIWRINGQKIFTTSAQVCNYVMLLTRTNSAVPKHKGLSTFIVPLDAAGIEIEPLETLSGERTNVTFYNDVTVPASALLGEVDGGWQVMTVALTFERGGADAGALEQLLGQAEAWARTTMDEHGHPRLQDVLVCERLAQTAIYAHVSRLLARRCAWLSATGALPGVEGSVAKLVSSEALRHLSTEMVDMVGPEGLRSAYGEVDTTDADGDDRGPIPGFFEQMLRHAQVTTIYGGTSEIQRGIIAERGLGLPRAR